MPSIRFQKTLTENEGEAGATGSTTITAGSRKGVANYNIRHASLSVMSYEFPFGSGRNGLTEADISNQVLGGWELTWTQTLQSGLPFTVGFSRYPTATYLRARTVRTSSLPTNRLKCRIGR